MVDRQDIDALLVGALYGELTPAEEARLAAHLESHPADRTALDDLKTARQAVRESKVFELQHEPPQAISALLLQEAHRRAPKPAREREEKESWFARLARSFLAHPAMAAAAMLVLVVGVAGTIYLRKGNDDSAFKAETVATPSPSEAPPAAAAAPAGPQEALGQGAAAAGSGVVVGLADDEKKLEAQQEAPSGAPSADKADQGARYDGYRTQKLPAPTHHAAAPSKPSIVVSTPQLAPKDLDQPRAKAAAKSFGDEAEATVDTRGAATGGGAASGNKESGSMNASVAQPRNAPAPAAPAPAPVAQAPAAQAAPPPPPPPAPKTQSAGAGPKGTAASSDVIARAQSLLAKAIQAAQDDKNCTVAAEYTKQIHTLSPAFYDENVRENRQLQHCIAYIKPDAERAKKAAPARATSETSK